MQCSPNRTIATELTLVGAAIAGWAWIATQRWGAAFGRRLSLQRYHPDPCDRLVSRPTLRPFDYAQGRLGSVQAANTSAFGSRSIPSCGDAQDKRRAGRTGLGPLGASTYFWDGTLGPGCAARNACLPVMFPAAECNGTSLVREKHHHAAGPQADYRQ
jgi:hypothetical protein